MFALARKGRATQRSASHPTEGGSAATGSSPMGGTALVLLLLYHFGEAYWRNGSWALGSGGTVRCPAPSARSQYT